MKSMGKPIVIENAPSPVTDKLENLEDKMADMLAQSGLPTTEHSTEAPTNSDAEGDVLPDIDDSVLPEPEEVERPEEDSTLEATTVPPTDELTWEVDNSVPVKAEPVVTTDESTAIPAESSREVEVPDYDHASAEMAWDTSSIPEFSSDEV